MCTVCDGASIEGCAAYNVSTKAAVMLSAHAQNCAWLVTAVTDRQKI